MREVDLEPPAMPDPGEGRRWRIYYGDSFDELVLQQRKTFLKIPYWSRVRSESFMEYYGNTTSLNTPRQASISYQQWANVLAKNILARVEQDERRAIERHITFKAING